MRRGALGAVLVAAAMAAPGVCAQDGGRLLVGSIGPEAEPVEIHQGVPEPLPVAPAPAGFVGPPEKPPTDLTAQERGESGGAPMASPTPAGSGGTDTGVSSGEGRPTPVIETTPLGGTGESASRSSSSS